MSREASGQVLVRRRGAGAATRGQRRGGACGRAMAIPAVLAVLVAGCGGTVPESRYYVLHYEAAPDRSHPPLDLVLGVESFSTQPLYRDRRIAYRASENEVVYYPYRYWAASPGELVADQLANHIRQVGLVRALELAPFGHSPDWLLSGHVQEFNQVKRGEETAARLEITVRLESLEDRRILREEILAVEKPVHGRGPEDVAEAMSVAVHDAGEQVIEIMREEAARR